MKVIRLSLVVLSIIFLAATSNAQEMSAGGQNVNEMKMAPVPGLPACVLGSVQSGDPTKGASIIFSKAAAGCLIPRHWHTPTENVMMVSGVARLEMKDGTPLTLRAGGFAKLPSRHVHQFRCEQACQMYIYSDAAFDIHYVDAQGNEIPSAEALKAKSKTGTK
jgi:quercetin dioxygenase-like cupin family protein